MFKQVKPALYPLEDMMEILNDEDCTTIEQAVHLLDPTTSDTMDMVVRVPTNGCSSFNETFTDGCPPLYVGDIYISLE